MIQLSSSKHSKLSQCRIILFTYWNQLIARIFNLEILKGKHDTNSLIPVQRESSTYFLSFFPVFLFLSFLTKELIWKIRVTVACKTVAENTFQSFSDSTLRSQSLIFRNLPKNPATFLESKTAQIWSVSPFKFPH